MMLLDVKKGNLELMINHSNLKKQMREPANNYILYFAVQHYIYIMVYLHCI